jgi:FKBP-type peptidyl-prolyl cis-trans isomerase SlyD
MASRVVSFHYTLKNKDGQTLDSSQGGKPMTYLEGSGGIIPGLESELEKMKSGDKKKVEVKAAEAYGEYDKRLLMDVPRTNFPEDAKISVGDQFRADMPGGPSPVFTVKKISDQSVSLDGNHPLAGQDLFFDVEITQIRDATAEEVAHGHAHGEHGHGHGDEDDEEDGDEA